MLNAILVATDASPVSNRAINMAADLASRYGARLHIIHVVRDMQLPHSIQRMAEVEKIVGAREDVLLYVADKILDEAIRLPNVLRIKTQIAAQANPRVSGVHHVEVGVFRHGIVQSRVESQKGPWTSLPALSPQRL